MSALEDWQKGNDKYLAAALMWLRLRLMRLAGPMQTAVTPRPLHTQTVDPTSGPSIAKRSWFGRAFTAPSSAPLALPAPSDTITEEQVAQAAAAMAEAEAMEPPPALVMLSRRFGLSRFEKEVLLLCAAIELDTGLAALCARAQDDPHRPYPTFALALALLDKPAWDVLSPDRPLRYWRLIEITQPAGQPLTASPLRPDERIVNYLKGLNYLDDRLGALVAPLDVPGVSADLPPSQQSSVASVAGYLKPGRNLTTVQLLGADAPSKQVVAAHSASAVGLRVYRLPAALVPTQAVELETLARLWQRESLLLPIGLYVDALGSETDVPSAGQASPVSRLLGRLTGSVVFLDTRDLWPGLVQGGLSVDVGKPTAAEQRSAWSAALGEGAGETPAKLTGQFNLGISEIQQIAGKALSEPVTEEQPLHDRLWSACLAGTRPRLDMLAQRLEPKATWDDIVLPTGESNLLRQIAAQVGQRSTVYQAWGFGDRMSRGLGISALFTGDAGTGKTMAAEVIANELRLNLYRIDLSAVVSKYIGETEKNLRRLFDAAEDGGAILFFDEADALFGKRSEVKDSHDRYANIEINYLLQRMEAYRGLAILATNMKSALDPAFMRRLRFVVGFPFPHVAERKVIWQKVFPPRVPTDGLDFDRLARLNLTGGNIHSVALNAAFTAAQTGTPVTMPLVLDAARTELRKLGRVVNELEFRGQAIAGRVV